MRGVAPVTIRTEDRRLRNGPNLLPDLESPSGTRSRSAMVSSSTTQDSMGKEWMMTIYQRWAASVRLSKTIRKAGKQESEIPLSTSCIPGFLIDLLGAAYP